MHGLIPKAVETALTERGIEPANTPNNTNVAIHEGQPLTFTAAVETVPPFDPGDLASITVTRAITTITDATVDQTLSGCANAPASSNRSPLAPSPTATRSWRISSARTPTARPSRTPASTCRWAPRRTR